MGKWLDPAARIAHYGLYVLLVAVPVVGIVLQFARGDALPLFGLAEIPSPWLEDRAFAHSVKEVHEVLAHALVILASMHAAAALIHHWIFRDRTLVQNAASLRRIMGTEFDVDLREVFMIGEGRPPGTFEAASASTQTIDARGANSSGGSAIDARKRNTGRGQEGLRAALAFPLDAGILLFDGRPVFGPSKTIRGVIASVVVTAIGGLFLGPNPEFGALVAGVAMAGDLLSSF